MEGERVRASKGPGRYRLGLRDYICIYSCDDSAVEFASRGTRRRPTYFLMHSNKDESAVEAPAGEQVGGGGERLAEGGVLERPGHPAGEGDGAGEFHGEAEGRDDWARAEVG